MMPGVVAKALEEFGSCVHGCTMRLLTLRVLKGFGVEWHRELGPGERDESALARHGTLTSRAYKYKKMCQLPVDRSCEAHFEHGSSVLHEPLGFSTVGFQKLP